MENELAKRFCMGFRWSIGKQRMSEETYQFYLNELSSWELTEDEWSKALRKLVDENTDRECLSLPKVKAYLRAVRPRSEQSNRAWLRFTFNGLEHSVRVERIDGRWIVARLVYHDKEGREIIVQRNHGEVAAVPLGATNVHYAPDCPAVEEPCPTKP